MMRGPHGVTQLHGEQLPRRERSVLDGDHNVSGVGVAFIVTMLGLAVVLAATGVGFVLVIFLHFARTWL